MNENIKVSIEKPEIVEKPKKPRKIKPFAENEALKRAQKKYAAKNREKLLEYARVYNKKWRETEDYEVVKAKQREKARKHYYKKKLLKQQEKDA